MFNQDIIDVLNRAEEVSIALFDGEYPYIVPLNFVFVNEAIYLHSKLVGKKVELLKKNPKLGFCIAVDIQVQKQNATTFFKSIIGRAEAEFLFDEAEKAQALEALARKYEANCEVPVPDRKVMKTNVIKLNIQDMTYRNKQGLVKNAFL